MAQTFSIEVIQLAKKLSEIQNSPELELYRKSVRKINFVECANQMEYREAAQSLILRYFSNYISYCKMHKLVVRCRHFVYSKEETVNKDLGKIICNGIQRKISDILDDVYFHNWSTPQFFCTFIQLQYKHYLKTFIREKYVNLYIAKLFIDSKIDVDNLTRRL